MLPRRRWWQWLTRSLNLIIRICHVDIRVCRAWCEKARGLLSDAKCVFLLPCPIQCIFCNLVRHGISTIAPSPVIFCPISLIIETLRYVDKTSSDIFILNVSTYSYCPVRLLHLLPFMIKTLRKNITEFGWNRLIGTHIQICIYIWKLVTSYMNEQSHLAITGSSVARYILYTTQQWRTITLTS